MKRKSLMAFLSIEAVLCIFIAFAREALSKAFTAAMSFPFEQIGLGLRALSLSGSAGNAASIILYAMFCLVPAAALLFIRKRRRMQIEDILLGVLSAVLFAVLYLMINPGMLDTSLGSAAGQTIGKAMLGVMAYSVLCGYLVLRVLRLCFSADTGKLQKYLAALLSLLNILFVYLAFGACFGDLLDAISTLRAGNTGNERFLGMSYVFLTLQYLVDALPYVLDVLVVFAAMGLLEKLNTDRYSQAAVTAAGKLTRLCGSALAVIVLSNIGFNLLQFLFIKGLMVVNGSVQIPLLSVAFVLGILLLAQFIGENKQLKDDNDMFI